MAKILIVEDNKELSSLLKMRLENDGFSVDIIGGGLALLSYLKGHEEPKAIILDLFIPEKSGLELLDSLVNTWKKTTIFVYSAQVKMKAMCLKYPNVCNFFSKTDDMEYLIEAVKKTLCGA